MSGGYVFRKILTNGNHGFNISQHRKMPLTTPFRASRTATLTILDRKIVKVTGRNSQSGDAKQTVSRGETGCFALKILVFSSPVQRFWAYKNTQTTDIQYYTQKCRKSANFRISISSAKLQTILAAFKWIDQGVLHRQTDFDKMTGKGVETLALF